MGGTRRTIRAVLAIGVAAGVACLATTAPAYAAGNTIKGHVTDNNGASLAGICVTAYASGHDAGGSAATDASGNYTIQGLTVGSYGVQFSAIGCALGNGGNWLEQWYSNKSDMLSADPVAVTAAQDTMGINAQMQVGGSIQGHVTHGNSVNLAGVCVSAGQAAAVTDASGNYTIQRLVTGSYRVRFTVLGLGCNNGNWIDQWYSAKSDMASANPVSVTAGQSTTTIDAQMQAGGRIQGHVTDNHGVSLPGICVGAGQGATFASAVTDSGGNYTLERLSTGPYQVSFSPCGTAGATTWKVQWYNNKPDMASADVLSVVAGQNTTAINAQMQPAASDSTASSTTATATGTSTGMPSVQPEGTSTPASAAVASAITMRPTTFAAENGGPSATSAARKGTTVSFNLNRAATVVFTVQRSVPARKVKHGRRTTCDRRTRANRKRRKCTLYIAVRGAFTRNGVAGVNRFHFTGRLNGRKLGPGRYRLVATPRVGHSNGRAAATAFRIVR